MDSDAIFVVQRFKKMWHAEGERIFLLHDNARLHTAVQTRTSLPNHPPSDMYRLLYIKHHLGGTVCEDVKKAKTACLSEQAASFYDEGIRNRLVKYDKCLSKLCSYVEKQ